MLCVLFHDFALMLASHRMMPVGSQRTLVGFFVISFFMVFCRFPMVFRCGFKMGSCLLVVFNPFLIFRRWVLHVFDSLSRFGALKCRGCHFAFFVLVVTELNK